MINCRGATPHVASCGTDATKNTNPNQHWQLVPASQAARFAPVAQAVEVQHAADEAAGTGIVCLQTAVARAGALLTLGDCGNDGAMSRWERLPAVGGATLLRLSGSATPLCLGAAAAAPSPSPSPGPPGPPSPPAASSCAQAPLAALPYCNASLPARERALDLVPRLTNAELVSLLHGGTALGACGQRGREYSGEVPAVPRLGVPPLRLNDGPQGFRVRNHSSQALGTTTQFPSGLAVGATFDPALARRWGAAIGAEFSVKGANVQLGPGMCLARVPNDGRNFEYMAGEDPALGAAMAAAAVRGIQEDAGVLATAKHYVACDQDTRRSDVSANVDERTRMEMYAPAFFSAVQAGCASVMCAYNKINNVHACENNQTLNVELKGYGGFEGFVVSDWNAAHDTLGSVRGGMDLEMPQGKYFADDVLLALVANGSVPLAALQEKARRILQPMLALGLFERQNGSCTAADVAASSAAVNSNATSPAHAAAARAVAAAGIVLLRNENGTLPLDAAPSTAARTAARNGRPLVRKIALFGASCDGPPVSSVCAQDSTVPCVQMDPHNDPYPRGVISQGGGSGGVAGVWVRTPAAAIAARAGAGVDVTWHNVSAEGLQRGDAARLAAGADAAVVVVGTVSGEGMDRHNLSLSAADNALVAQVAAVQPRTTAVVIAPGAVLLPWADAVGAALLAFMPGQAVGDALADVLFGAVNPSGKLPLSLPNVENETLKTPEQWPGVAYDTAGQDLQANYSEKLEVGYRWYDAHGIEPAFPFGHGLTYTTFAYSNLECNRTAVSFDVANSGARAGFAVPQLYLGFPAAAGEPPRQLKRFDKLAFRAGASQHITLPLDDRALSVWDAMQHRWAVQPGVFGCFVGESSRDVRLSGSFEVASA
eukprot:g3286.t1